jgi:hypothetical protein
VPEEWLETEAVEEPAPEDEDQGDFDVRPLPERASTNDVSVWKGDVRTAALAAAGGLVAGAATVAVVRATRPSSSRKRPARRRRERELPARVIASRSFLVDVHLLGSDR